MSKLSVMDLALLKAEGDVETETEATPSKNQKLLKE
jgi:hypothetical protein